jgi:hypothetical protein
MGGGGMRERNWKLRRQFSAEQKLVILEEAMPQSGVVVAEGLAAALAPRRRTPNEPPPPACDLDGMLKRLHHPTVRRFYGELATRAEAEGMGYRTYLKTLVSEEIIHRAERYVNDHPKLALRGSWWWA